MLACLFRYVQFTFNVSGKLIKVMIFLDNIKAEESWFLKFVEIVGEGMSYFFPCSKWFNDNSSEYTIYNKGIYYIYYEVRCIL